MIARLKPYPAMKQSGVEWLGDVPEHWQVVPGRACFYEKQEPNTGMIENTVLSLSYGRIIVKPEEKLRGLVPESYETYQVINPGDIICRPTDLQNDLTSLRFGISKDRGIITSAYMCFATQDRLEQRYGHLLFHSYDLKKIFYGFGSGLRQNLSWDDFKYLPCVTPPLTEQAAIDRFLGHVDRRVRRFVRAKQKLIGLLEEQKQAIIDRAVTRGLDPNVRLKPSGVEWLGDVPEHWEVCRLRDVVSEVTSGSRGWSSYAADEGPLFIRIANLRRGALGLSFDDVVRLNLPDTAEGKRTRVRPGDLLLSITAYIGSIAVVPDGFDEAYVSQHVARCSPRDSQHNPRWLGYVLLSEVGQTHGRLSLYGGTKDGLSLDDVKNYPMLLPLRREQEELVASIEQDCAVNDEAIGRTERLIALLREYRTRLIADVVTGKLDVREAATNLPVEPDEPDPLDDADDLADEDDAMVVTLEELPEEAEA